MTRAGTRIGPKHPPLAWEERICGRLVSYMAMGCRLDWQALLMAHGMHASCMDVYISCDDNLVPSLE